MTELEPFNPEEPNVAVHERVLVLGAAVENMRAAAQAVGVGQ